MHILSAVILISSACAVAAASAGQNISKRTLINVFERQTHICQPVPEPATCEASCGPGYITCVSLPNCYNPSLGETCCSDGEYCPKGYYCTDAGCCPDGSSLADCGAQSTLATVPPTSSAATSTSSSPAAVSSSPATTATSSQKSQSSASGTSVSASVSVPKNGTYTTSTVASQFTGAANTPALGGFALPIALVGAIAVI